MNNSLNKQLNGLLTSTGLSDQKGNLVLGITQGRSESRADLTDVEATQLIGYLKTLPGSRTDASNKMRRKMISYAHQLHWYAKGTQKVDIDRLNNWCSQYGYLHKKLNEYTYDELPKLVSQFRAVFSAILNKL